MNPNKAAHYETVVAAAAAYRTGSPEYARTLMAQLEDPIGDTLNVLGVVMAVLRNGGTRHDAGKN